MRDDGFVIEITLIALLIGINGLFAAAEMALVSARKSRLSSLAEAGDRRARAALRLKADPDRFLATIQVGITLVGTLASAVGGVAAIERLEPFLAGLPFAWAEDVAEPVAVVAVVVAITFVSLVLGELVPKSLALRDAERVALLATRGVDLVARLASPVVAVLTATSRLVLRAFGGREQPRRPFHTLEDLRAIAEEAEREGVGLGDVLSGAVEFHERQVREIMTPRARVVSLPLSADLPQALGVLSSTPHSRLPVYDRDPDDVVGMVYARDLYELALRGGALELQRLLQPVLLVPQAKPATALLEEMRRSAQPMAVVVNEHGGVDGIVTMEDLVEVIVGEIPDEGAAAPTVRTLPGGHLEVDGATPVHELNADHMTRLPESTDYVTVAGLVLQRLGSVPRGGESVLVLPHRITVTEVQQRRIARVRIETVAGEPDGGARQRGEETVGAGRR